MTGNTSYWEQIEEHLWRCRRCGGEMLVDDMFGDYHPADDKGWIYCPYCGRRMV